MFLSFLTDLLPITTTTVSPEPSMTTKLLLLLLGLAVLHVSLVVGNEYDQQREAVDNWLAEIINNEIAQNDGHDGK